MTSTGTVSGETSTATMLATSIAGTAGQNSTVVPASGANSVSPKREVVSEPVDTVTLLNQVQDNKKAETKNATRKEKTDQESDKKQQEVRTISDVLFAYNSKGDLRIKFMDSGNKLIYQTPPVLFARMYDLMLQVKRSVNTQA